ncbi:hypothetical protein Goklo_001300 [Gossypium klotzschianum]|uniref:Uncharacterized protein n=1 Tax=Gossypium klotzschianum TaxID=34286 RepID=A0A7J8W166_9ROSI|nr:hypothetical protein [Gossypium klotzschianum]
MKRSCLQSSCASKIRYCRRYLWRKPHPPYNVYLRFT